MSKIYWSRDNISGSLKRIWQNITRGWNDSDCWSLDLTIAEFAYPRLKKLREKTHGYPSELSGIEEWYAILDKMIQSMYWIINDDIELKDAGGKHIFVKVDDNCSRVEYVGTEEQKKNYEIYFKEYTDKITQREKDIQEGLDLFGKYFRNLWD